MYKLKELLFWRFSLFAGLLALASILALSYFYYRIQANTPFAYLQALSNLSEYRVLDSRVSLFGEAGQVNFQALRENLMMQSSLISSTEEILFSLEEKGMNVPSTSDLAEIEGSIRFRAQWLLQCQKNSLCETAEWHFAKSKAWENCERLLSNLNLALASQEESWSKNLRIFYVLSVLLLLSTLFFAAGRK